MTECSILGEHRMTAVVNLCLFLVHRVSFLRHASVMPVSISPAMKNRRKVSRQKPSDSL